MKEPDIDLIAQGTADQLVGFDLGPSVTAEDAPPWGGPSVGWAGGQRYLAITTYGSGSCPTGPVALTTDGQNITVRTGLLYPDRDPCTADLSAYIVLISAPNGLDPDLPSTVHLDGTTIDLPPNIGEAADVIARTPADLSAYEIGPFSSLPPVNDPEQRIDVAWVDGGRYLAFVTFSPSCPTAPAGLRRDGGNLFVTTAPIPTTELACGVDSEPTTTIVRTPSWMDSSVDTGVINSAGGVLLLAVTN